MPLEEKIKQIEKITGFKELTVCEDVTEHYNYWRDNINPNKYDCCNLYFKENENQIPKAA